MERKLEKLLGYIIADFGRMQIYPASVFLGMRTFKNLTLVELIGISSGHIDSSCYFHKRERISFVPQCKYHSALVDPSLLTWYLGILTNGYILRDDTSYLKSQMTDYSQLYPNLQQTAVDPLFCEVIQELKKQKIL